MFEDYLRYNELTREALEILRGNAAADKLDLIMNERDSLVRQFEEQAWPGLEKAAIILKDTLELEKECISIIANRRKKLKQELVDLKSKKHAISCYQGNT